MPENRTYRLDRAAYVRTTKRLLYRRFGTSGALALVMAGVVLGVMAHADGGLLDTLPYSASLAVFVVVVSSVVNIRAQLVKQRPAWDSYELTMGPSVVRRDIAGLPSMEVLRAEVTRIDHAAGRGVTIATADRHRFVFVPEHLVGFDEVKERLADWRPIEAPRRGRWGIEIVRWSLILASLLAALIIPDIRFAIAAAVVFYLLLAMSAREVVKTRVVDASTKRKTLGMLVWFSLGPILRLFLHFVVDVDPTWPPGG